jgi:two-component system nitrogen regulation sensor histidine kinase NtrY
MLFASRIRYRLAFALALAALLPVLVAIALVESTVRRTSERFFVPEVGQRLDKALGLYQELARSVKEGMQLTATTISSDGNLREAARAKDRTLLEAELGAYLESFPHLVSLEVIGGDGARLARVDRGYPLDRVKENALTVVRPLSTSAPKAHARAGVSTPAPAGTLEPTEEEPARAEFEGLRLVATFGTDRATFDELESASRFVDAYRRIEKRRQADDRSYVYAFATLLGLSIVAAVAVSLLLARGITGRVSALAQAAEVAATGDLATRVRETGQDEITHLAKGFNRMLAEIETSRARIEYLNRVEAWQEMARRLAHEIKNPLTPIQLAVQDMHRRYAGDDKQFRQLLDTTLEIVEDEVGTLRRLVSEFSEFARLPQPELSPVDLAAFLREQGQKLTLESSSQEESEGSPPRAAVEFELPRAPVTVLLDRQLFRRALLNLLENANQALRLSGKGTGRTRISLRQDGDYWCLSIEDSGPGIPEDLASSVFDPYVTGRADGVGLGLAIVKKVVVDHGGRIAADKSDLGGARIRLWLPAEGTKAHQALLGGAAPAPSAPLTAPTPFPEPMVPPA